MPKIIPKTDSRLLNDWRSNVASDNIKSTVPKQVASVSAPASLIRKKLFKSIDEKYRLANPTIGDQVSDIGTKISSGLKTLGGSVVGDAIKSISPDAANTVSKYTAGMISPTSDEDIKTGRLGSALDKVNLVSQGATGVMLGELGAGAMNYAGGKIAGKIAGEAIQNNATTDIINRVAKTKYEIPTSSKDIIKKGNSGRSLHQYELDLMQKELESKGVLDIQKTPNLPFKKSISNAVYPFGYGNITERAKNILRYSLNAKNPKYMTEGEYVKTRISNGDRVDRMLNKRSELENQLPMSELTSKYKKEYANEFPDITEKTARGYWDKLNIINKEDTPNRVAAYETFTGNKAHKQIYDVSSLSKNNELIYTLRGDAINKNQAANAAIETSDRVRRYMSNPNVPDVFKVNDNQYVVGGLSDSFSGTMGGYNMKSTRLKNGNFEFQANDVWDINPLRKKMESITRNIESYNPPEILKKPIRKALKKVGDIDPYQVYGIGKPMNVKTRMEVDPSGKLIRVY